MEAARQALSVLVVFALLTTAVWALRRRGAGSFRAGPWWRQSLGRAKALESIERLALTPQHSLHLVRIDGRVVVVATHPQGCALLHGGANVYACEEPSQPGGLPYRGAGA